MSSLSTSVEHLDSNNDTQVWINHSLELSLLSLFLFQITEYIVTFKSFYSMRFVSLFFCCDCGCVFHTHSHSLNVVAFMCVVRDRKESFTNSFVCNRVCDLQHIQSDAVSQQQQQHDDTVLVSMLMFLLMVAFILSFSLFFIFFICRFLFVDVILFDS